jgi:hypothetical protein
MQTDWWIMSKVNDCINIPLSRTSRSYAKLSLSIHLITNAKKKKNEERRKK